MGEKEYIIPYREVVRKRQYHSTKKGKLSKFVVQLEVMLEGRWREVVRYDCAHGYSHRDSYNLAGQNRKEDLHLRYEDALDLADDDLDEKWETYRAHFLRGDFP